MGASFDPHAVQAQQTTLGSTVAGLQSGFSAVPAASSSSAGKCMHLLILCLCEDNPCCWRCDWPGAQWSDVYICLTTGAAGGTTSTSAAASGASPAGLQVRSMPGWSLRIRRTELVVNHIA